MKFNVERISNPEKTLKSAMQSNASRNLSMAATEKIRNREIKFKSEAEYAGERHLLNLLVEKISSAAGNLPILSILKKCKP